MCLDGNFDFNSDFDAILKIADKDEQRDKLEQLLRSQFPRHLIIANIIIWAVLMIIALIHSNYQYNAVRS